MELTFTIDTIMSGTTLIYGFNFAINTKQTDEGIYISNSVIMPLRYVYANIISSALLSFEKRFQHSMLNHMSILVSNSYYLSKDNQTTLFLGWELIKVILNYRHMLFYTICWKIIANCKSIIYDPLQK